MTAAGPEVIIASSCGAPGRHAARVDPMLGRLAPGGGPTNARSAGFLAHGPGTPLVRRRRPVPPPRGAIAEPIRVAVAGDNPTAAIYASFSVAKFSPG